MPELPEVEILRRHLEPLLKGRTVRHVTVRRAKVLGKTPVRDFKRRLQGATFQKLERRGKLLLFELKTVRAGISPRVAANRLTLAQVQRVGAATRAVLQDAIAGGSTIPLDWAGEGTK